MPVKLGSSGGGGVNDIYTDSTGTVGTASVAAGDNLKLDSTGQLLPEEFRSIANVNRNATLINAGTSTYYNTAANSQSGNPVLPDGRSLYCLTYSGGGVNVVVLETDGKTRAGTTYVTLTANYMNTGNTQFTFYQIGENSTYYLVGLAWRSYYNTYTSLVQGMWLIRVEKANNNIGAEKMNDAAHNWSVTTATSYWNTWLIDLKDVDIWHTCHSGTVSLSAAPKGSNIIYRFTAYGIQSNGTFNTSQTDYEDLAHGYSSTATSIYYALDIVKIDDTNGIFLVLHETANGTQTLTKLVVSSTAQITASTIATIDSSYSGLNAAISRVQVSMVGAGTGTDNLCFFAQPSTTSMGVQRCSYNSSTDALTWGNYALLDSPTVGGVRTEAGIARKQYRQLWAYSEANHKIYFANMTANKGYGWVLDIINLTLKSANLMQETSSTSAAIMLNTSAPSGDEIVMVSNNPTNLTKVAPYGVDTGALVTTSVSAIAREAGVSGETIDVSLVGGITSASDLPATKFLKKQDLFFPYTIFVDGSAVAGGVASSVIKRIQGGRAYINNNTVTITHDEVDLTKSSFSVYGGTNYNNAFGAPAYIEPISSTQFYIKTNSTTAAGYCYWEVVEYV